MVDTKLDLLFKDLVWSACWKHCQCPAHLATLPCSPWQQFAPVCQRLCNIVCVQSIASFLGPHPPHLNTEHPPQSADSSAVSTSCAHPADKVANKDVDGHFSRICQCPGGVYVMIKAQCQVVSNCENWALALAPVTPHRQRQSGQGNILCSFNCSVNDLKF